MLVKYIPDGYWNSSSSGSTKSHEAICVLNPHEQTVHIELVLYFEDRAKIGGFQIEIEPERTKHIRMDQIRNEKGLSVPQDTPYAIALYASDEVYVQYSRVDTSQKEMAIATTMV